jgi:hypothetical protein
MIEGAILHVQEAHCEIVPRIHPQERRYYGSCASLRMSLNGRTWL